MKHEIINRIIAEVEAKSYLEIGYGNGANFDKIECEIRTAIDPVLNSKILATKKLIQVDSDTFFSGNEKDFGVVFIDGLHRADQVRKDVINSLKCNAKAIIIHDTIPHSKEMQEVPRIQKEWTGDVWRTVVGFIENYPDVKVETYRADYGLSVLYPNGMKARKHFENMEMIYEEFKANEVELLRIVD